MKRFTLFLALLCMCIGAALGQIAAVSDLNNTTAYTIKSVNRGFIYYDAETGNKDYLWSSSYATLTDATPDGSENQRFAFLRGTYTAEGAYYLYCVPAARFAGKTTSSRGLMLSDQPTEAITFTQATKSGVTGFVMKFSDGQSINITNWEAIQGCKVIATGADEGNIMTITAVATEQDFAAAVAKIDAMDVAAAVEAVTAAKENALAVIANVKATAYYTRSTEAISTAEAAVNAVSTDDVTPLNSAERVEACNNAVTILLNSDVVNPLVDGAKVVLLNRLYSTYAGANGSAMVGVAGKTYPAVWQVVMTDAENGIFRLKNLYTGKYAGMHINKNTQFRLSDTEEWSGTFKAVNGTEQGGCVAFRAQLSTNNQSLTDPSQAVSTDEVSEPLYTYLHIAYNATGTVLAWKAESADYASHYTVQAVTDEEVETFETTARTNLGNALTAVDNATSTYDGYIGSGIGQYTIVDKTQAQAVYDNAASTVYQMEQSTASITPAATINQPVAGKFYRFKSSTGSNRMLCTASETDGYATQLGMGDANGSLRSSIFMLKESGSNKRLVAYGTGLCVGKFASNDNTATGSWLSYQEETGGTVSDKIGNFTFSAGSALGTYHLSSASGRYLYNGGSSYVDAAGSTPNTGYDWVIEEVRYLPVYFSDLGVATLWSPVALKVADGSNVRVKAYTGENTSASLKLTEITTGVIPAETAVVLEKAEGAAMGTDEPECVYLPVTTTSETASSDLTGQAATIDAIAGAYTLQNRTVDETTVIGMYQYNGSTLAGFKAYLVDESGSAEGFAFVFGGVTSIEKVTPAAIENNRIYDLSGRRVLNARKGLYIVNGKKLIIK